jgi:hypothetical protein
MFKNLVFKMNKVWKSVQDMDEKFSKVIEILKKKTEILKMKKLNKSNFTTH